MDRLIKVRTIEQVDQGKNYWKHLKKSNTSTGTPALCFGQKRFIAFWIFECLTFIHVPILLYCISSISKNFDGSTVIVFLCVLKHDMYSVKIWPVFGCQENQHQAVELIPLYVSLYMLTSSMSGDLCNCRTLWRRARPLTWWPSCPSWGTASTPRTPRPASSSCPG